MIMLHWLLLGCVLSDGINRAQTLQDFRGNIWEKSGHFQGDILLKTIAPRNIRHKHLWPYGEIPYSVHSNVGPLGNELIDKAMKIISKTVNPFAVKYNLSNHNCQIRFRKRVREDLDYVVIIARGEDDCSSYVGVIGGPQELHLAYKCLLMGVGVVIHELLHALGFEHQQAAFDRDEYVFINTHNIEPGFEDQFELQNWTDYTTYGIRYDYNSIMHYSSYAFAKILQKDNWARLVGPTITGKAKFKKIFTYRGKLSSKDKQKLRLMYCPRLYKKDNPPYWY